MDQLTAELIFWLAVFLLALASLVIYAASIFFRKSRMSFFDPGRELVNVINQAPVGIFTINQYGVVKSFNPKMAEISGARNTQAAIGLNVLKLPSYKSTGLDNLIRQALGGKPFETEVYFTSFLGKKKTWRHYRGVPLYDREHQQVEKVLFLVEDITARKRLEILVSGYTKWLEERSEQLKEEQARFEASINSLNVGFVITDTESEIVTINAAAKRILCVTKPSPAILRDPTMVGLNCTMNDVEKQLAGVFDLRAAVSKCLDQRQTVNIPEFNFKNLILHIFITPVVVFNPADTLRLKSIGAVILVEDITQEKILERSRDEFFSIASHELRTPLTAIRGNTSLIRQYFSDKIEDQDLKEMIESIHESAVRLITIVNDFLDVSRLEQGRIEFKNAVFDFTGLVREVFKELETLAKSKGLYLKLDPGGGLPGVKADRDRVKQVLTNLVGNSVKFTHQGGVTVKLSLEAGFLKTEVEDTGIGIREENQKLLFRKFQQAETSILTRESVGGTGLGLYISKLLVEGMQGRLYLERSWPGKGSVFAFTLPLGEARFNQPDTKPLTAEII